ncbi:hypothetical protein EUX98_g1300 [Antrodiella citrinella]|uniref:BTB domain-containing protein n=1 Tax=Antrodiella citrinella TaxID=2447956 RepID=A0A4S4N1V9_9APHY|nr:hypothetical protein EUX98_g1300 [Antrodiella citrinella]
MQSRRTHSTRPSISGPFSAEQPVPMSSPTKSPPAATNGRSRAGVMSATLPLARSWLSRSSSSSSGSSMQQYAPSKPTRISEPKLDAGPRSGMLGAGATVVRTPQDALAGTSASSAVQSIREGPTDEERIRERSSPARNGLRSPPLPPIPDFENDEIEELEELEDTRSVRSTTPPRPTRVVPPTPPEQSPAPTPLVRTSSLKSSPPMSEYFPPVPSLPSNLAPSPPQAPFDPILISPPPTPGVDLSKVIVSLETSTMTYRTTLSTLTSRPSLLGTYLKSLTPNRARDTDELSVYSTQSEENSAFHSIFHHHLTSSGLLSQTSTSMHIFLDRPSAPYAHILTYLRTPPSAPEQPAVLPRPVQLSSSSSTRLDALLELRDEARYLDLDELYKLCTDEIRLRYSNALGLNGGSHSRGISSVSITSSRSLGTLRELAEHELEEQQELALAMRRNSSRKQKRGSSDLQRARSKDSGIGSASPGSFKATLDSTEHGEIGLLPPVSAPVSVPGLQQRLMARARGRSETRKHDGSQPTGEWI